MGYLCPKTSELLITNIIKMKNSKFYHYTHYQHLASILDSGYIKLATTSKFHNKEKAVAWISTNPHWENTATKMLCNNQGQRKIMSFEEQLSNVGCARIQVREEGLFDWPELIKRTKKRPKDVQELEEVGIERGADPSEWHGSLKPITRKDWLSVEIYKNGGWKKVIILDETANYLSNR